MADKNKLREAGDYVLDECEIVSYKTAENSKPLSVDMRGIVASIEITESIFENSMVGKLQVYDAQDVRTILPITGFEKLNLKFSTPGLPGIDFTEVSGKQFHVYKIERINQDPAAQRTQGYDIYFTSKEYYYNFLKKVSRAYEGPIEIAIEDILRNKKYLNSTRALFFEPTKTNAKYVLPNLRPFDAINYLCAQSVSKKYKNAGYVFYESPVGYFFRSLESMFAVDGAAGRPYKFKYFYQPTNIDNDAEKNMHNVVDYVMANNVNVLDNMKRGMYANKLTVHDAFNKTIKTHAFDYYKSFGDYFHTETEKGNRTYLKQLSPFYKFDDTDKDISQFPESKSMVVTETSKVHNNYEFVPSKDTLPIRMSQLQQLHNNLLSLIVHGNSLLGAGDIISFDLPLMRPLGEGQAQQVNPYTSGRYVITSIKHMISREMGKYQMSLKCSKDAVKEGYIPETNTYQSKKEETAVYNIYEEDRLILSKMDINPVDYT